MSRYLLVGDYLANQGPGNVNKEIIRHRNEDIRYVRFENKYFKFLDMLVKVFFSKVIIISGISRVGMLALSVAKKLGKRTAYIMHGCAQQEAEINGVILSPRDIRWENKLLENADLLLPVSKRYSKWVKEQFPQYLEKTQAWQLGVVQISKQMSTPKEDGVVATAGGDIPRKRNLVVSDAVEMLNGSARLQVYGPVSNMTIQNKNAHTDWVGHLEHELFLDGLRRTQLFVVNSVVESFNISVMEALSCGCSVLVSDNVGAADLLDLTPNDIIFDVNDQSEIAEKIQYLLKYPNYDRISAKINWDKLNYDRAVERLVNLCIELTDE